MVQIVPMDLADGPCRWTLQRPRRPESVLVLDEVR